MSAWSSLSSFVSRNKTAVIVTATVLAAGTGATVYYALNAEAPAPVSKKAPADEKPKSKSSSSEKKSKKKSKNASAAASTDATRTVAGYSLKSDSPKSPQYPIIDDFEAVAKLSASQRQELGNLFKDAGNAAYGSKDYKRALELYADAVKCYDKDAVYHSNRAACYMALQDYEKVVDETSIALKIQPYYTKCLSRRAVAHEKLKNYSAATMDFTAVALLTNFQDKAANQAVDRILKAHAEELARSDKYVNAEKTLPSASFVTAYLQSFTDRELPAAIATEQPDEGSAAYDMKLAMDAISRQTRESYQQAYDLIKTAATKFDGEENPDKAVHALALEYLATFKFLIGDADSAVADINRSLELHPTVPAYIKRSSLYVENGNRVAAEQDFESALKLNPQSADVYYHRAQLGLLSGEFDTALKDYARSNELDSSFVYGHIQMAVSQYRTGSSATAKSEFKKLLERFPNNPDVHTYYGEIILDGGDVQGAIDEFDVALALERKKPAGTFNVLPLINKALALFQLDPGNNVEQAAELCKKAVTLDPLNETAIATLAQCYLQMNKTQEALDLFYRNAELVRSEAERVQSIQFALAAETQLVIARDHPTLRAKLSEAAAAAAASHGQ